VAKLKPWPIVAGVVLDAMGSIVVGTLYVLAILSAQVAQSGQTVEDVAMQHLIVLEIIGLLLTATGGFLAGRLAGASHIYHGIAVGIGGLLVWLPFELIGITDGSPAWYELASFLGVVPAGALGGYLSAPRVNRPLQLTSGGKF
jgi:hypothetical protein